MADGPRLTTQAVEQIEVQMDAWKEAMADGEITPEEARNLQRLQLDLYQFLMYVDDSFGLAVTMLRRGHEAPSVTRRMNEHRHELVMLKGGKGHGGPNAA